jgi:hypothetical protein
MKAQTIGRTLGIGLRVAGRLASQRLASGANPAPTDHPPAISPVVAARARTAQKTAARTASGIARGAGGFLRPFRRVGHILWLEVTGVFFLLPVLVFTPYLWRIRAGYAQGPEHRTFLLTAGIMVVFLYLGVSSFWRARKR